MIEWMRAEYSLFKASPTPHYVLDVVRSCTTDHAFCRHLSDCLIETVRLSGAQKIVDLLKKE